VFDHADDDEEERDREKSKKRVTFVRSHTPKPAKTKVINSEDNGSNRYLSPGRQP
jgi:hypothetical protein